MSFAAAIPVANMAQANADLEALGYGPRCFSRPAFNSSGQPTYAVTHAWGPQSLIDAIKAIPNVVWSEVGDTPKETLDNAIAGLSLNWKAPTLEGQVQAGNFYGDTKGKVWLVIQNYDASIWPDPEAIPALVREVRLPGTVSLWKQPIDQFDAYKLVNPFTGEPDQVTHNGQTWRVVQADGAGNNVWAPGVFGWEVV